MERAAGALLRMTAERSIRSFVMRSGRITAAQQRALDGMLPKLGIPIGGAPLDLAAVFGRPAPCTVEIGFGNGENLLALAARHPERNYLGIEVHRAGIGRLLLGVQQQSLSNVRVICHDAVEVLSQQIAPRTLDEVLVLFPDPWPKKRHHKRRLIQSSFVRALAERLQPGGRLRLATDWEPYAHEMLTILGAEPALRNVAPSGQFAARPTERLPTRFERRGERLGHSVWDLEFEKL